MIIRVTGGIGNQMFQYALKLKLESTLKQHCKIDTRFYQKSNVHNGYELDKVFGISTTQYDGSTKAVADQSPLLYKICFHLGIRKLKTAHHFTEIRTCFCPEILALNGNNYYIDGYWQSEDYFIDIEDDIRKNFYFPPFTELENIKISQIIKSTESVSLHVRRGDYVGTSRFVSLGNTNYYQKAIKYIKNTIENPLFVVLSDDIRWCKENLDLPADSIFVTWNQGNKSYRDMQIMSICKHNIIANSSFSWWGAWLNNNSKKIVLAPNHFFNGNIEDDSHIVPEKWKKIEI